MDYQIIKRDVTLEKRLYSPPPLKKNSTTKIKKETNTDTSSNICSICNKSLKTGEYITANKGKTLICRKCLSKTF